MDRERAAALMCAAFLSACGSSVDMAAVGTLERERIEVVAEFSEPITQIHLSEGAHVSAGQPILEQDSALLATELSAASAKLDEARALFDEVKRGSRVEQIRAARARLAEAEAHVVNTRKSFERWKNLVADNAASRAELDDRKRDFEVAAAARNAARSLLDEAVNGSTAEMIRAAAANVEHAEAALEQIRTRGNRLLVVAPVEGRVDALPFHLGERPPVGGVVAVILSDSTPYARVYVSEEIRVKVKPGTVARITVDGIDAVYEGVVRHVSHNASFTPYFALTEHDRGRLAYVAEIDLTSLEAGELPTGLPCEASFDSE